MSMFHELMMRKKEQIMYATIKGTLTENDGVFSGFSASNYLQLQNELDFSKNFKFAIKFKTSSNITSEQFVMYHNRYPNQAQFALSCHTNSKLLIYFLNNLGARIYTDLITLEADTEYNVMIEYTITNINVYVNNTFVKTISVNYSSFIQAPIVFGMGGASSYFRGSIDLNNSYIKLGSTKYNLQAVVGYTIVGSPTITDGVVSGFDLSNYLQIPTDFTDNDFEILLKLEDIGTALLARTIFQISGSSVYIGLSATNKLIFNGISGFIFADGFNTSGLLYLKATKKGLDYSFGYSNDGITYTMLDKTLTAQVSTSSPNNIFRSGNWSGIGVKLHIKDCFIKINNKLWFNGQQA